MSGVVPIFLKFYRTRRGDFPVVEYIKGIADMDEKAEIEDTLQQIQVEGAKYLISGCEDTKRIEQGLFEIRKSGHRIYYIYCMGNLVYLLHACKKQKNKAEESDKDLARARKREIERQIKEVK